MSGQVKQGLGFGTSDLSGERAKLSGGGKAKRGSHLVSGGGRQCVWCLGGGAEVGGESGGMASASEGGCF